MSRLHRSTRAGFTLIEVVLAMFVLLIGMTSILGLLSFGAALSRTSTLRQGAADTIESIVADLEETLFPLVVDEAGNELADEPVDVQDRPVPGHPGLTYRTTSRPNPDDPREYRVDVEVHWATGGTQRSKRFTTLLLREVPFGERLRSRIVERRTPEKRKKRDEP